MTILYDPVSKGFYNSKFHKDNVPSGALEVTEEKYKQLLEGQAQGKFIISDEQGNPVLSDRPQLAIDKLAARKRREMDNARDATFAAGMGYTLPDGSVDVVQTRPQDQINLMGLGIKAERLVDDGVTDPVMEFRGESNITHMITPADMVTLTDAALTHIEGIYQHSWDRKDAIGSALGDETLTDDEKRVAIEAVTW